ncbi:MAG TPA: hypothetical protein PLT65_05515 [Bacilli bacterium]|nr:hypothetical protein [Bacilli bacterium]
MEEFDKILNGLLLEPGLTMNDYVWIYEDNKTKKYYVSTKEINVDRRYDRDGEYDPLVAEGKVYEILETCRNAEKRVREHK